MTLEDLDEMDTNDDGEVDLFEFMSFMLSKMGKVDIEMMNDLKDLFESLDETLSNTIQKEDLPNPRLASWREEKVSSLKPVHNRLGYVHKQMLQSLHCLIFHASIDTEHLHGDKNFRILSIAILASTIWLLML